MTTIATHHSLLGNPADRTDATTPSIDTPATIRLASGSLYAASTPASPEDMGWLFTVAHGPVERPDETAAAITLAMVRHAPSDWASLAQLLGTDEATIQDVSERLGLIHGLHHVGPTSLRDKLDETADYLDEYNAGAIQQKAEAFYLVGRDPFGFALK